MKYKFNKPIFQVWFVIMLILLGIIQLSFVGYKEYKVECFSGVCNYNASFFENMYIIEDNLRNESLVQTLDFSAEKYLTSDEYIIFSNYEECPFLVANFLNILFISLIFTFLINHIWFKKTQKRIINDNN